MLNDFIARNAVAIVPNDTIPQFGALLYVGTLGNVTLEMEGQPGVFVLFTAVPAGTILRGRFTRVRATGTTASNMVALSDKGQPPASNAAPVASGTGTVGQILSVTNGTWIGGGLTFTYQWLRNGVDIALNAVAATYTLVAADAGTSVSCHVTATNVFGSASRASNAIAVT